MVVELLGPHTWTLDVVHRQVWQQGCRHAKVPWYLCLGPARGLYQDISQTANASRCNYRWSWEDCSSPRVSCQDDKVVKQTLLDERTKEVVCQDQRNPFFVFTHISKALLGG